MNLNNKNEKITGVWDKMKPTDEIKNEIFNGIMQKQSQSQKIKRPKFKRIVIIAAIMTVIFALGTVAYVVSSMVFYDMDGNLRKPEFTMISPYEIGSEEDMFEKELGADILNGIEENVILFILREEIRNISYYEPYKKIEDYDELKNYLQTHGGEQLSLPEYIPEGYKFQHARVYKRILPEMNYKELELIYTEEKFGNIYEKYIIPEDKTCISKIIVYYEKDQKSIFYEAFFFSGRIEDMILGSTIGLSTEPEVLNIPKFEKSVLMKYGETSYFPWMLRAAEYIKNPVDILNISFISKTWRDKQNPTYLNKFEILKSDLINYTISADSEDISHDEIIKMAESIK